METGTSFIRQHAWQVGAVVCAGALLAVALTPGASADPIADKQAQARALADQIDALGRQESALAEQYDKARLDAQAAAGGKGQAARSQEAADAAAGQARDALAATAVDAYVHGGTQAVVASRTAGPAVPAAPADGGILRGEYIRTLASSQTDTVDRYRQALADAKAARAGYQAAEQAATRSEAEVAAARSAAVASQHQLQAALAQVKGDIATLVAQAQAAKAAADALLARQAQARLLAEQVASRSRAGMDLVPAGLPPPVGAGAAAAVRAAESRLGLPYIWGASGPGQFDCSGLTMWAWAAAGVSIPHYSGAQYGSTTHISMADLQPGDLVFPADTGEHVAMYIGGGMVIQAPHTGAVVNISPLSSWFVRASRP